MTIEGVESFLNVCKCNSFSKAAEIQFITQPSLSARISALEKELGVTLIERTPTGITVNENGKKFLPYGQKIVNAYYEARKELLNEYGEIQFGCISTLTEIILPEIIQTLKRRYPFTAQRVLEKRSLELLKSVRDENCSFAILALDKTLDDPDLESLFVYADPVLAVAAKGHRLCQKKGVLLASIAPEPMVQINPSFHYGSVVNQLFSDAGLNQNIAFRCNTMQSAIQMIKKGIGIGFLPKVTIKDELESGSLEEIKLTGIGQKLERKIYFVYKKGKYPFCGDIFISVAKDLLEKYTMAKLP